MNNNNLHLFQEKSKLSLAEVYEQEYLKQQGKAEEAGKAVSVLDKEGGENPKEVDEIRQAPPTFWDTAFLPNVSEKAGSSTLVSKWAPYLRKIQLCL